MASPRVGVHGHVDFPVTETYPGPGPLNARQERADT